MIFFGNNKKRKSGDDAYQRGRERYFEAKRQMEEYLRKNPRPQYQQSQPGEEVFGPYGRIYGTNPNDWKQTKEPAPGKKIDLKKGSWKPQFTVDDVVIIDLMQVTGQDIVRFVVKDFLVIDLSGINREEMAKRNLSLNINIDKHTCKLFVEHCIQIGVLPTPMEELL